MAAPELKRYIVRKYVMARTAEEALMKEPMHVVDDVYADDEWLKAHQMHESAIGFSILTESDFEPTAQRVPGQRKPYGRHTRKN